MRGGSAARMVPLAAEAAKDSPGKMSSMDKSSTATTSSDPHPLFRAVWYGANCLLILAILAATYSCVWEYSTRRYLNGFSDAIVPESSSAQEKIEAILNWMSHGPARQDEVLPTSSPDRDPTDTLNYASLLQVCGSATNAFVNLADSAGLPARRLLLLDSRRMTRHVVAEVAVDGRWIVVDPAFRAIFRGASGELLTREELRNPAVFAAATSRVHGYDPTYTFDVTAHVRISRLRFAGIPIRHFLDRFVPGWEDSVTVSLMLERESLAAMVITLLLVAFLALVRIGLRWYGERRLGVRPVRIRQQFRRALHAFVDTAG